VQPKIFVSLFNKSGQAVFRLKNSTKFIAAPLRIKTVNQIFAKPLCSAVQNMCCHNPACNQKIHTAPAFYPLAGSYKNINAIFIIITYSAAILCYRPVKLSVNE
jgi:hypothetical protein